MENSNRHVIKNTETTTKADLMTMSTPPHLLSVALGGSEEDERPLLGERKRQYNHIRSKW